MRDNGRSVSKAACRQIRKFNPAESIGLETVYGLGEKEYKEFAKYEKIWKQIFSLR
jgi:hypothetical protein